MSGHKNDARDAAGIAEAAARPATPRVTIKTPTQQTLQAIHRVRSRLSRERTAVGNELRGLLGEFGIIIRQGHAVIRQGLVRALIDEQRPALGEELCFVLEDLLAQWRQLDERLTVYDTRIADQAKASEAARRLMSIPGIGPINATLLMSHMGTPQRFPNGRQFSASIGLVPRQFPSGGKTRLKGISKRGNGDVRRQLVHGARAALRQFQLKDHPDRLARWACDLAARVGQRKAIVALANKLARICWSVLAHERVHQSQA